VADTATLPPRAAPPLQLPGSLPVEAAVGDLAVEQRFAVVPEWMLDSTVSVSDTAFRLYAVLARYGNTSGVRMARPGAGCTAGSTQSTAPSKNSPQPAGPRCGARCGPATRRTPRGVTAEQGTATS